MVWGNCFQELILDLQDLVITYLRLFLFSILKISVIGNA